MLLCCVFVLCLHFVRAYILTAIKRIFLSIEYFVHNFIFQISLSSKYHLSTGAEINFLFIRKYPMASKAFRDLDKEKNGVISRSQFLKVGDTHAHNFFF
jgi:hypothetical protein